MQHDGFRWNLGKVQYKLLLHSGDDDDVLVAVSAVVVAFIILNSIFTLNHFNEARRHSIDSKERPFDFSFFFIESDLLRSE